MCGGGSGVFLMIICDTFIMYFSCDNKRGRGVTMCHNATYVYVEKPVKILKNVTLLLK